MKPFHFILYSTLPVEAIIPARLPRANMSILLPCDTSSGCCNSIYSPDEEKWAILNKRTYWTVEWIMNEIVALFTADMLELRQRPRPSVYVNEMAAVGNYTPRASGYGRMGFDKEATDWDWRATLVGTAIFVRGKWVAVMVRVRKYWTMWARAPQKGDHLDVSYGDYLGQDDYWPRGDKRKYLPYSNPFNNNDPIAASWNKGEKEEPFDPPIEPELDTRYFVTSFAAEYTEMDNVARFGCIDTREDHAIPKDEVQEERFFYMVCQGDLRLQILPWRSSDDPNSLIHWQAFCMNPIMLFAVVMLLRAGTGDCVDTALFASKFPGLDQFAKNFDWNPFLWSVGNLVFRRYIGGWASVLFQEAERHFNPPRGQPAQPEPEPERPRELYRMPTVGPERAGRAQRLGGRQNTRKPYHRPANQHAGVGQQHPDPSTQPEPEIQPADPEPVPDFVRWNIRTDPIENFVPDEAFDRLDDNAGLASMTNFGMAVPKNPGVSRLVKENDGWAQPRRHLRQTERSLVETNRPDGVVIDKRGAPDGLFYGLGNYSRTIVAQKVSLFRSRPRGPKKVGYYNVPEAPGLALNDPGRLEQYTMCAVAPYPGPDIKFTLSDMIADYMI